jgi:hypothetical protein
VHKPGLSLEPGLPRKYPNQNPVISDALSRSFRMDQMPVGHPEGGLSSVLDTDILS